MNPNNNVDLSGGLSYNVNQDVINEAVVEHYLNQPHVVKMDEQKPINDTDCRHETLVADPTDTIGEAIFHACANNKCGVGFYIHPTENKKLT